MLRLLARWVLLAVVIGVVAAITPGIQVEGGFGTLLWIALLFGLVSTIIGPIVRLFSLPLIILTLGAFLLVVNAALLGITAALTTKLQVDGFGSAVLGGFLIAVLSWATDLLVPPRKKVRGRNADGRSADGGNAWRAS